MRRLEECDGRASNPYMRQLLGWPEAKYWKVQNALYEEGKIEKGKGKGGTVILVDVVDEQDLDIEVEISRSQTEEKDLYVPMVQQLQKQWAGRQNLDSCHVENVARQGSRDTGGSWTRPDIVSVGLRTYEYLPNKNIEIHTFEVKASYDISVKGVMEALSHREFATKAYVIYCTDGDKFSDAPEAKRIETIAGKYGIGVIAANDPDNEDTWEEVVPASRIVPDPEEMDLFIKRTLSQDTKSKILKWLK